jgi:hypothetical protein
MKTIDGGPAFPFWAVNQEGKTTANSAQGMSLRDWFAGMAVSELARLAAEGTLVINEKPDATLNEAVAYNAYAIADAMLAERNK